MNTPLESIDNSQFDALHLLMAVGYTYLSPADALDARGGRLSNLLLESILREQLKIINPVFHAGKEYLLSEANLNTAILLLRELPEQEEGLEINKYFHGLLTTGSDFEQHIGEEKVLLHLKFIDWERPENNVFHVTKEFRYIKPGESGSLIPDIVLFVNGLPLVIIECKRPGDRFQINSAIEQLIKFQQQEQMKGIFAYSALLLALTGEEAKYATTGNPAYQWAEWRELFIDKQEGEDHEKRIREAITKRVPTEQDTLIYNLCRKDRLLELIKDFIFFDDREKKIPRYWQYFTVKQTIERIRRNKPNNEINNGIIYLPQGSGKTITLVWLARKILQLSELMTPKIIVLIKREELLNNVIKTFKYFPILVREPKRDASNDMLQTKQIHEEPEFVGQGASLLHYIKDDYPSVILTPTSYLNSIVEQLPGEINVPDIFIFSYDLITQQGDYNSIHLHRVFAKAHYLIFTSYFPDFQDKEEKENLNSLIVPVNYSIRDALKEKNVLPVLYEERRIADNKDSLSGVKKSGLVEIASHEFRRTLSDELVAHFRRNVQGTGFKGLLVVSNKATAVMYLQQIREIGGVSVELYFSTPSYRKEDFSTGGHRSKPVTEFYQYIREEYVSFNNYRRSVIERFRTDDSPELLITVDGTLTGIDLPNLQIIYLARLIPQQFMFFYTLSRTIRTFPGKDYGYVIDYVGNIREYKSNLTEVWKDGIIDVSENNKRLPKAQADLWSVFIDVGKAYNTPVYTKYLFDVEKRQLFYDRLFSYIKELRSAFFSFSFLDNTDPLLVNVYKNDANFFLKLRVTVKKRYVDDSNFGVYEVGINRFINEYLDGKPEEGNTEINILDKDEKGKIFDELEEEDAKADFVAASTLKLIQYKFGEDSVYSKLQSMISDVVQQYHSGKIAAAAYLDKVLEFEYEFVYTQKENVPFPIRENDNAIKYFRQIEKFFTKDIAVLLAIKVDSIVKKYIFEDDKLIIDWWKSEGIKRQIRIELDDEIFNIQKEYKVNVELVKIDELIKDLLYLASS